jgi:hypothetical protein
MKGKSLPSLQQRCLTTGGAPHKLHRPIKAAIPSELGILPLEENVENTAKVITTPMFEEAELEYRTENDIEYFCKNVLEDIIRASRAHQITKAFP